MRLPVPKTFRDTKDRFALILLDGPDFKMVQRAVTYTVTPEMVFESLLEAIVNLRDRAKKPEAKGLFDQCMEELRAVQELYRSGEIREAKRRTQAAEVTFNEAGKAARGARQSDLWLDKD
jgi:uncharacterized protein with PIN domain